MRNTVVRPYLNKCLPVLFVIGIVGLVFGPGCGGGGGGGSSPAPTPTPASGIQVSIQPATVTLQPQGQTQFTGSITNTSNPAVLWSVTEGASGGAVSDAGLYVAPVSAGIYHVVARSAADTTRYATAVVTVPVVVSVAPTAATTVSEKVTFTSSVNAANGAVNWTVQEGAVGGTITPGGVYTPPMVGGIFHVVATSVLDGSARATATVTVPAGGADGVIQ